MVTRQELKSQWDEVKSRLRQNWRELSEHDLANFNGDPSQLIGAIQRKTGASWNEIEAFLASALRDGWSTASQIGDIAGQYRQEANQLARDSYDQLAAFTADYSRKVASTVKRRPVESLAIAFGLGLAASALVLLSSRRR